MIGRFKGRSAVASAAYRAAEGLHDALLGRDHDYIHEAGFVYSEILLPEGAPPRWLDCDTLISTHPPHARSGGLHNSFSGQRGP